MAKLDAVIAETLEMTKLEKAKKASQKCRLIADPYIQVGQIQICLEGYMSYMKTSDLWSLVCPPPSLAVANWHTAPNGQWLAKTSNLLYDVLDFAPNTKLQGTKVTKALQAIHLNKTLFIDRKLKTEDAIDRISLSLRIVLSMLRAVKMSEVTKSRIMRGLSKEEAAKLNLVLKKVVLPAECFGVNGEEFAKEDSVEPLDLQPGGLALVVDKQPEKPVAAPSQVSSPASSPKFSMTSLLGPMPSIFNRILKSKVPTQPTQDDELLEEAMAVVPEPAQTSKSKKPPPMKAQKAKKGNMGKKGKKGNKGNKAKPAKQVQQKTQKQPKAEKTSKAKQTKDHGPAAPSPKPNATAYKVDVYPTEKDTYRNLYTSRHHNKAKSLALKSGLSMDAAKAWGRKAAAEASAMWDEVHAKDAEPWDVD